jgi:hypothetical protein
MDVTPPPDNKEGRFHFLIIPETTEADAAPIWRTCADEKSFLEELYAQLILTRAGWCYLIVDGMRALFHDPEQSFRVVLPDKREVIASGTKVAVSQDGRFKVLEPAR